MRPPAVAVKPRPDTASWRFLAEDGGALGFDRYLKCLPSGRRTRSRPATGGGAWDGLRPDPDQAIALLPGMLQPPGFPVTIARNSD
jgi:hypothetical protein